MEKQFHEIDPEGDIIIRLGASNSAFATWHGEPDDPPSTLPRFPSENVDEPEPELAELEHSDKDFSVEIRVSSRHLILASPQAKRMLEGAWKEPSTLKLQGSLALEEKDWDVEALLILMNILHCRNKSVPRKISLEMFVRVAVLVDYYECYEAVEIYSDMWLEHLREELPATYCKELVLWICVSWIFRQSAEFGMATSVALQHSKGPIQTMELPIPERIVRKLSVISSKIHA
jgi:hypothetical protein